MSPSSLCEAAVCEAVVGNDLIHGNLTSGEPRAVSLLRLGKPAHYRGAVDRTLFLGLREKSASLSMFSGSASSSALESPSGRRSTAIEGGGSIALPRQTRL